MRIARLLSLVLAILTTWVLLAPAAGGTPPFRLPGYVTDSAGVLDGSQLSDVKRAVDQLYNERQIRLWVVYVDSFSGQGAVNWAESTRRASDLRQRCHPGRRHHGSPYAFQAARRPE
jgi:uncharacterized membrane protein YgcG